MPNVRPNRRSKCHTLTFRHESLIQTMHAMIAAGVVRANSLSERIEQLLALDIRKHATAMLRAGIRVPDFVRDTPADILAAVRPKGGRYARFFESGAPRGYTPDGRYAD